MSDILIRDVDPADLDQIRSAAADQGTSVQRYLLGAVHAQATYLRRQRALETLSDRLEGRPGVADDDRDAVLDAVDTAHADRDSDLTDFPRR